jgi:hypothetical protein
LKGLYAIFRIFGQKGRKILHDPSRSFRSFPLLINDRVNDRDREIEIAVYNFSGIWVQKGKKPSRTLQESEALKLVSVTFFEKVPKKAKNATPTLHFLHIWIF